MKLIMTKGLPASGKSTWAKQYLLDNPNTIRINKDDLRAMLHGSTHSKRKESFILQTRNYLIVSAFKLGQNVIVDDTNFNPIHEQKLRELAKEYKAEFLIQDFTDVSLSECITRDSNRPNSVGKSVIIGMYNEYLKEEIKPTLYNSKLPDCFIFDIDGTLAIMGNRSPYEWLKVGLDTPNVPVVKTLEALNRDSSQVKIFIFSGRDSVCRELTEQWLGEEGIAYEALCMRPENDQRKDSIIKQELYEANVRDKYNVLGIFDDRNQVVDMWRSLGLPCYQVAEGDF